MKKLKLFFLLILSVNNFNAQKKLENVSKLWVSSFFNGNKDSVKEYNDYLKEFDKGFIFEIDSSSVAFNIDKELLENEIKDLSQKQKNEFIIEIDKLVKNFSVLRQNSKCSFKNYSKNSKDKINVNYIIDFNCEIPWSDDFEKYQVAQVIKSIDKFENLQKINAVFINLNKTKKIDLQIKLFEEVDQEKGVFFGNSNLADYNIFFENIF